MSNKPLSVDLALIRANTLAKKGELNQAMAFYRAVLEKFPGNKRAIEGLKSLTRSKCRSARKNDPLSGEIGVQI